MVMACSTPGVLSAMALICSSTRWVRSSEAASGNWAAIKRYPWSSSGMKPVGTRVRASAATTISTAATAKVLPLCSTMRAMRRT